MPFELRWTNEATSQFNELMDKALQAVTHRTKLKKAKTSPVEGLFKQVQKSIEFLKSDPKHPGLRTHEYSSLSNPYKNSEKVFEAYAQNRTPGAYRIFWCYGPSKQQITIIAITHHP